MSVSGISSSLYTSQSAQSNLQQLQQVFKQLGQDLQSGNLSAAQSDFATLQKLQPQSSSSSSSTQSNNPIAQAFNQLSSDLQSGNLSAAQQDYTTLQQAFQSQATQGHHHHRHGGGSGGGSEINQLLSQLGTALQSGNLSTAQSTFTTLEQDLQGPSQTTGQTSSESNSSGISVTV